MKNWIVALFVMSTLASCEQDPSTDAHINKILPLGASRVQGSPPIYYSYRYELWKQLRSNDWKIDFLGSQVDGHSYPPVNDENFDPDHEGHSGWTSGQLLADLSNWTNSLDTPEVVLFSSPGGNDAIDGLPYDSAIENVVDIVQGIQSFNPNVTIIIEKMAPGHSAVMMGNLAVFHARLLNELDSIASALSTSTSQVLTIDMATGFTNDMLADPIHYNQDGATYIANKYYDALTPLLEE